MQVGESNKVHSAKYNTSVGNIIFNSTTVTKYFADLTLHTKHDQQIQSEVIEVKDSRVVNLQIILIFYIILDVVIVKQVSR